MSVTGSVAAPSSVIGPAVSSALTTIPMVALWPVSAALVARRVRGSSSQPGSVPCHSGASGQVIIKEGYGSTFLTLWSRGHIRSSGRSLREQIPVGTVTVVWHE